MIQDIEFPDEQIDLFAASFSMHHLPQEDKKLVFDKIHHALRPGGIFLYSDLMVDKKGCDHNQLLAYWKDFVLQNANEDEWQTLMTHYAHYDYPAREVDLVKWLQNAGFSSVQTVRHDRHWVALAASR